MAGRFAGRPTPGNCDGVLLWHIDEGAYGDIRLDGLNVAMLGSFVGNVWGEYTDSLAPSSWARQRMRCSWEQIIFGGQASGWPVRFGEIGAMEIRGMEVVPIQVSIAEDLSPWSVDSRTGIVTRGGIAACAMAIDVDATLSAGSVPRARKPVTGARFLVRRAGRGTAGCPPC